jgi:hypothetical protein
MHFWKAVRAMFRVGKAAYLFVRVLLGFCCYFRDIEKEARAVMGNEKINC